MKKQHITAMFGITAVLCGSMLTGCSGMTGVHYQNAEKYMAGGGSIENPIKKLDLHWVSGEVKIEPSKEARITFTETANREIGKDQQMRYWLENDTLHIQFCASNNSLSFLDIRKDLTLMVPEDLMLEEATIDVVSAAVDANGLKAEELEADSVSGYMTFTDCEISDEFSVESVSGSVYAKLLSEVRELSYDTVSGTIEIEAEGVSEHLEGESTSGKASIRVKKAPKSLDIDSVSGGVDLYVPEDINATVKFSSVSGDVCAEFIGKMDGKKFIYGDGSGAYKIKTTSGDLELNRNE